MRWASPPDSVVALRSSVRYSRPTLTRNPSRAFNSLTIWRPICSSRAVMVSSLTNARARSTGSAVSCAIDRLPIVTASDSGFRRAPLHAGQRTDVMSFSISSLIHSEDVSSKRFCRPSLSNGAPLTAGRVLRDSFRGRSGERSSPCGRPITSVNSPRGGVS